ncbi:LuxR C-terminal-related transcriptional regulator [Streptomyces kutzneri]|uniref:LuxR C-terminal-related transcriptional regulator n=1 Tax=Streptomyces kutzneri TaxID=3051179 RepID=UPI0028D82796|nr:LuxR C-terminal-related transcriptional regulator [Streptomyces sp. DSM 40907]
MHTTDIDRTPSWMAALAKVGRLTAREREVFLLLADGPTNGEIAGGLFISERTVRAHIVSIQTKLGLRSRLKACLAAAAYIQTTRTALAEAG